MESKTNKAKVDKDLAAFLVWFASRFLVGGNLLNKSKLLKQYNSRMGLHAYYTT
jgi:hypothetical protein